MLAVGEPQNSAPLQNGGPLQPEEREVVNFFSQFVLPNNPTPEKGAYLLVYLDSNRYGQLTDALKYYAEKQARDPREVLDAFEGIVRQNGGPLVDRRLQTISDARWGMEDFAEHIGFRLERRQLNGRIIGVINQIRAQEEEEWRRFCLFLKALGIMLVSAFIIGTGTRLWKVLTAGPS